MKERNKSLFVIILGILICILIYSVAECEVFTVPNYAGGINALFDSTDLKPNQAVEMTNFTLDKPNVMTSRQGFSAWNSVAVDTSQEIEEIFIYEPYADSQRMVFVTDSFIYVAPGLGVYDTATVVDWSALRMGNTNDSLQVTEGSGTANLLGTDFLYAFLSQPSEIRVTDDTTTDGKYTVNPSLTYDKSINFSPVYTGANDTSAYTVYPKTHGAVSFEQSSNKLFVCNPIATSPYIGSYIYDDTSYQMLAVIDTGIVSSVSDLDGEVAYTIGQLHTEDESNILLGDSSCVWTEANIDTGYAVNITVTTPRYTTGTGSGFSPGRKFEWLSFITKMDTSGSNHRIWTEHVFPYPSATYWQNYKISQTLTNCVFDNGYGVNDPNKNWLDDLQQGQLLTSFYSIAGDSGYSPISIILCNEDSSFQTDYINTDDTLLYPGDQYYVFSQHPIYLTAHVDTVLEFPNFEQITFYNNILFGHGWNYQSTPGVFTRQNFQRLWFSDIALPSYIRPNNTIDLDFTENITTKFQLRGNLYIASDLSIWRYSGIPRFNAIKTKVVSNNGVPSRKNWVKATEEYGYFVNLSGIYRFDGVRPQKVSKIVDNIIKKNYASRIVTVYQDRKLYVSFPDSNFTLVYNEDYESFIKLGFGMTAAYAPPDTNIIYFGHPIYKGRIYSYPNGLYYDNTGEASATYDCTYESGWMDLGGFEHFKAVTDMFIPIRTLGNVLVEVYKDFESTPCDSVRTDSLNNYVYHMMFDNDCYGEYFQIKITASTDSSVLVRGSKLIYTIPGDAIK